MEPESEPEKPADSPSDEDPPPTAATCDSTKRGLSEAEMRRLTTSEVVSSLRSVFGSVMDAPKVAALVPSLPSEATIAVDHEFDNRIHDVEALETLAHGVAREVMSNSDASHQILDCDPATELAKCRATLLDRVLRRLFRRPLTAAERTSYGKFIDDMAGADGIEWALVRAIVSPHFHQHLELESSAASNGRVHVDSYAVASRLAYALTGTLPDEELLAAAEKDELEALEGLRTQAKRLISTDAARERVREILLTWIKASPPDPSTAIAATLKVEGAGLGDETKAELLRFIDYTVFDQHGTLQDLWGGDVVFPFTDRLATLLGVSRSDGPVKGVGAARGLFLRPASLLTSATSTSPIVRGAGMRRAALCEVFPVPDPALVAQGKAIQASLSPSEHSDRERAEAATSGAVCQSCHSRINAFGYLLENFGPAGEWRTDQKVIDDSGKLLASFPIDSHVSDIQVDSVGAVDSAAELGMALGSTKTAAACLSQRMFVGSRWRFPSDADECLMQELTVASADTPVLDVLVSSIVNDDIFYRAEAMQ